MGWDPILAAKTIFNRDNSSSAWTSTTSFFEKAGSKVVDVASDFGKEAWGFTKYLATEATLADHAQSLKTSGKFLYNVGYLVTVEQDRAWGLVDQGIVNAVTSIGGLASDVLASSVGNFGIGLYNAGRTKDDKIDYYKFGLATEFLKSGKDIATWEWAPEELRKNAARVQNTNPDGTVNELATAERALLFTSEGLASIPAGGWAISSIAGATKAAKGLVWSQNLVRVGETAESAAIALVKTQAIAAKAAFEAAEAAAKAAEAAAKASAAKAVAAEAARETAEQAKIIALKAAEEAAQSGTAEVARIAAKAAKAAADEAEKAANAAAKATRTAAEDATKATEAAAAFVAAKTAAAEAVRTAAAAEATKTATAEAAKTGTTTGNTQAHTVIDSHHERIAKAAEKLEAQITGLQVKADKAKEALEAARAAKASGDLTGNAAEKAIKTAQSDLASAEKRLKPLITEKLKHLERDAFTLPSFMGIPMQGSITTGGISGRLANAWNEGQSGNFWLGRQLDYRFDGKIAKGFQFGFAGVATVTGTMEDNKKNEEEISGAKKQFSEAQTAADAGDDDIAAAAARGAASAPPNIDEVEVELIVVPPGEWMNKVKTDSSGAALPSAPASEPTSAPRLPGAFNGAGGATAVPQSGAVSDASASGQGGALTTQFDNSATGARIPAGQRPISAGAAASMEKAVKLVH